MHYGWILAQATPTPPPAIKGETLNKTATTTTAKDANAPGVPQKPQPQGNPMIQWGLLIALFVLMYLIMFQGPRKKQQKQRQMIDSLKKNDRVQTIGGILGTVLDVKENEVTIKVDESNNTKIKVIPAAISRVITDEKS